MHAEHTSPGVCVRLSWIERRSTGGPRRPASISLTWAERDFHSLSGRATRRTTALLEVNSFLERRRWGSQPMRELLRAKSIITPAVATYPSDSELGSPLGTNTVASHEDGEPMTKKQDDTTRAFRRKSSLDEHHPSVPSRHGSITSLHRTGTGIPKQALGVAVAHVLGGHRKAMTAAEIRTRVEQILLSLRGQLTPSVKEHP